MVIRTMVQRFIIMEVGLRIEAETEWNVPLIKMTITTCMRQCTMEVLLDLVIKGETSLQLQLTEKMELTNPEVG